MHFLDIKKKYLKMILEGRKTVEYRVYDDKREKFKIGNRITLKSLDDNSTLVIRITGMRIFQSFNEAIESVNDPHLTIGECSDLENDLNEVYEEKLKHYYPLVIYFEIDR